LQKKHLNKSMRENLKIKESEIRKACLDYLRFTGWFCFHIYQTLGSYKGICDAIAIKGGKVLFIEFKTSRGKQSQYQKEFQDNIEKHGGRYLLIRSLEDLMKEIKGG